MDSPVEFIEKSKRNSLRNLRWILSDSRAECIQKVDQLLPKTTIRCKFWPGFGQKPTQSWFKILCRICPETVFRVIMYLNFVIVSSTVEILSRIFLVLLVYANGLRLQNLIHFKMKAVHTCRPIFVSYSAPKLSNVALLAGFHLLKSLSYRLCRFCFFFHIYVFNVSMILSSYFLCFLIYFLKFFFLNYEQYLLYS